MKFRLPSRADQGQDLLNLRAMDEALNRSHVVVWFDPEGNVLEANRNFLDLMGYTIDEVRGAHHRIFLDPDEAAGAGDAVFWEALRRGEVLRGEFSRISKDGQTVWLDASYTPVPAASGHRIIKVATDITASKLKALDAAGQVSAITRSQGTVTFSLDGTILEANENFLTTMGYRPDEVVGRHHSLFVDRNYAQSREYGAFWASLAAGEFQSGEFCRIGRDGRQVWIQATYNPILDHRGKPVKVVKFAIDVTDRRSAMNAFSRGLAALAKGDLSARIKETVSPEFVDIRTGFNETMDRLDALVGSILAATEEMVSQSATIAEHARELSTRSDGQANALVQTAAAMEEISSTVSGTATHAETANASAEDASQLAAGSEAVVGEAVEAMGRIEKSSGEISSIIQVIESIAFQTNLLALNAGVEAARAGDSGRGFAVVASEVRVLAQRAADAARDITALIQTSNQEVVQGADLVRQTGGSLARISTAVTGIAASVAEITGACREQALGIAEITNATASMDDATRKSAALAVDSAAGAARLAGGAENLRQLVGFFSRTPQADTIRRKEDAA